MKKIKLNSGYQMPQIGLGTWKLEKTEAKEVILKAFKLGYRHFDCASIYGNTREIGEAFNEVFNVKKSIKREDCFITSKLWNTDHSKVREACQKSLKYFNIEYLDLYLIHWPVAFGKEHDENGRIIFEKVSIQDTWRDMEKLVEDGLVKSIGISNFNIPLITDMLSYCKIKPAVHQYESHPFHCRKELDKEMKYLNITVTAYSSLGSSRKVKNSINLKENDIVKKIAKKHGKTSAQVLLRFGIDVSTFFYFDFYKIERSYCYSKVFK